MAMSSMPLIDYLRGDAGAFRGRMAPAVDIYNEYSLLASRHRDFVE